MIEPRPYQIEAHKAIMDHLFVKDEQACLLIMATGTGKTVVLATLIEAWPVHGRILFIAHREELVLQAADTFKALCPNDIVEIEMGEERATHNDSLYGSPGRIVCASKDSLHPDRLKAFKAHDFAAVLVDEAHHAVRKNKTYNHILRHFKHSKIVGVTATADRMDNESLRPIFGKVVYNYDVVQAVADSYLVPIQIHFPVIESLNLDPIPMLATGELDPERLNEAIMREETIQGIVDTAFQLSNHMGQRRRTLLFGSSVAQAELMAELLNRRCEGSARCVHGKTDKDVRKVWLKEFSDGVAQFMTGCDVFTEGYDEPRIRIVVPKPTGSRAKYAQMIGRGTRSWPEVLKPQHNLHQRKLAIRSSEKPSLLVADLHGVGCKHKLVTALDVMGGNESPEVLYEAYKRCKGVGKPAEVNAEIKKAREAIDEAARMKKREIIMRARFSMKPIDPFDLFDIKHGQELPWFRGRLASDRQIDYIRSRMQALYPEAENVNLITMSMSEASTIIETIKTRQDEGPPSAKMASLLIRYGYDPKAMTFSQAREQIKTLLDLSQK